MRFLKAGLVFGLLLGLASICRGQQEEQAVTFEVKLFEIRGNTLLDEDTIAQALRPFTGKDKTAEDVEKARDQLEKTYHDAGYPAVLVNIPEQTVEDGVVRLKVIESTIDHVRVTGNRYFTSSKILKELSSLREGEMLYVPRVQEELARVNRSPDLKVALVLAPGREPGTIDVELKVVDKLPIHGSLDVNNRSTHDTTPLRLNGLLRYDNLWMKEHSVSLQYQTSPQGPNEVEVIAGSYVLPAPWNDNNMLALYGVWSDSQTAFGEGFQVTGKGNIFGVRYVVPLPEKDLYTHNLTVGLDYKDFAEAIGFMSEAEGGQKTPITYLPLLFSYNSALPDSTGRTQFSAGVNMAFRGLVADERQFEIKRFKGKANYLYGTGGITRAQKLPLNMGLLLKVDGQWSDGPLISNEQYTAGGMESVRGYKESELLGDDAVHGSMELIGPDMGGLMKLTGTAQMLPFLFYDIAALKTNSPLPGQDKHQTIDGTGLGLRGAITKYLEYEVSGGVALRDTDKVQSGDYQVYFKLKAAF